MDLSAYFIFQIYALHFTLEHCTTQAEHILHARMVHSRPMRGIRKAERVSDVWWVIKYVSVRRDYFIMT